MHDSIGNLLKYVNDRGGPESSHRGRLHWPGTSTGFPFRGEQAPMLRGIESDALVHTLDYHSRLFKLWEPEEKSAFDAIMDRIVNGWYMQHRRVDKDVDGHAEPAVWLEWVQIYGELPAAKSPGSAVHENHRVITLQDGLRPDDPRAMQPAARPSPEQVRAVIERENQRRPGADRP